MRRVGIAARSAGRLVHWMPFYGSDAASTVRMVLRRMRAGHREKLWSACDEAHELEAIRDRRASSAHRSVTCLGCLAAEEEE